MQCLSRYALPADEHGASVIVRSVNVCKKIAKWEHGNMGTLPQVLILVYAARFHLCWQEVVSSSLSCGLMPDIKSVWQVTAALTQPV